MKVGVPREIKDSEYRVAITPAGVLELTRHGHEVFVERDAGGGSAITDDDYVAAGARILGSPDDVWESGELILKVKEPIQAEYHRMRAGQVLFTFLHLAAAAECARALMAAGVTAIGYETVELPDGTLPLLAPMSEVAGRLATQVGAQALTRTHGGRGVLLGGVPGVHSARVVIIGAGVAGMNAAVIAAGMRAEVLILDRNAARLIAADTAYHGRLRTITSNVFEVKRAVSEADLVIGAVLVHGAKAPVLVTDEMVAGMKRGSVLVDVSIDQGGCFESSRPTTHAHPTFEAHGSLFYCVTNMPGAVPCTSTWALTNVTLPYVVELAGRGWENACSRDPALARGVNVSNGHVVYPAVAAALGLPCRTLFGGS